MKNNLNTLVVDTLIVHDVPKKFSQKYIKENPESDVEDIILSEVSTEFDQELTRFFHDRITATIGSSSAFEIEFDSALCSSKVQAAIKEYFDIGFTHSFPLEESDSIRITQEIAKELHDVQTARNPGGMLLFIPCHKLNFFIGIRIKYPFRNLCYINSVAYQVRCNLMCQCSSITVLEPSCIS